MQETRGWNEAKNGTVSQRLKEEANDYRYFPEPDIPPIRWTPEKIDSLKATLPELPNAKLIRFEKEFGLLEYDAEILTREIELANYFEEAVKVADKKVIPKQIANYIINKKPDTENLLPAELIKTLLASSQTLTVDEKELRIVIQKVLKDNTKIAEDYKKGKESVLQFAVGQVIRILKQKIDTKMLLNLIKEEIK